MKSIEELQKLVVQGFTDWEQFGHVNTKEKGELLLFNYNIAAQLEGRWNWFERVCRGIIFNKKTGEVVARPYDKFFNWNENHVPKPNRRKRQIVSITEKMDGSLGIMYRDSGVNGFRIATRGSFESEQAIIATEMLNEDYGYNNLHEIPYECTLLFEIIYPENRIVVDYKDRRVLVLIGARNRFTGEHYEPDFLIDIAEYFGFHTPTDYSELISEANRSVDFITSFIENWPPNQEGLVVEFNNGSFWKFKSPEYCRVHKLLSTISFKNVLEAVKSETIDDVMEFVPEHFEEEVKAIIREIEEKILSIQESVRDYFERAPKSDRKEYALWVRATCPELQVYMFPKLDNKDIIPLILKHAFRNREDSGKHLIGDS
jgi:RNA ligase